MIAKASAKYLRVSPTKVRLVTGLIKGKNVLSSMATLKQLNKGCTPIISKVLQSAIDNAKSKGLMEDQLFISKITADQGPSWKRFRAAAFGRATRILKRTTHLNIELDVITK